MARPVVDQRVVRRSSLELSAPTRRRHAGLSTTVQDTAFPDTTFEVAVRPDHVEVGIGPLSEVTVTIRPLPVLAVPARRVVPVGNVQPVFEADLSAQ